MLSEVPHSRPLIGAEEVAAVERVVASGRLAQGAEVEAFERELADVEGSRSAAAVAHGTGALHLVLLALGAGPGKSVVLPSYSCVSLLNAVAYTGATPVLVDSVPDAPDADLSVMLERSSAHTVAAIVPHLFGRVVPSLRALARQLPLIEDGTQSFGAPGVGRYGRACVYSFYATKMLAGGEGGAVTSNRETLLRTVRDRRSYDHKADWMMRYNYKMTDIAAALLRAQLARLPGFLERRRALAAYYRSELGQLAGVQLPAFQEGDASFRFVLRVERPALDDVIARFAREGIRAARPVHRTLHQSLRENARNYPQAQRWWREALSIPLYPALSDDDAARVVAAARKILA